MRPRSAPGRRRRSLGLSLVELMVGITIGLFILAGATVVVVNQLGDNRRLLLEAQVQQDLRATVDLVARDLPRAAYWAQTWRNVWPDSLALGMQNPYTRLVLTAPSAANGTPSLVYDHSEDEINQPLGTDNDAVDTDERVGFRYNANAKTVEMMVSDGNWQALTDPAVIEVTQFGIALSDTDLPLPCAENCPVSAAGCPLVLRTRDATITVVARAVHDPSVTRSAQTQVRLRNDVVSEACP